MNKLQFDKLSEHISLILPLKICIIWIEIIDFKVEAQGGSIRIYVSHLDLLKQFKN